MTVQTLTPREKRIALQGMLTCCLENGEIRSAYWHDISRTGAGVRLHQELPSDIPFTISFLSPLQPYVETCMRAQVAWLRHHTDCGCLAAGLRLFRDDPETALAFAALGYLAEERSNNTAGRGVLPVWSGFRPAGSLDKDRVAARRTA